MKLSVISRWGRRALFLGAALTGLAAVSRADTTLSTTVYSCRNQNQSFTVPTGADYIIIKAWGGGGGCGSNTSGGDGSFVQATCDVSAGQSCTIKVGAGGTTRSSGGWPDGASSQRNGCGGGGGSTQVVTPSCTLTACGGGGGGLSHNGYAGNTDGTNHDRCGDGNQDGCDGGGNGAFTFTGSWRNTSTQCGGNGNPPCSHDSDYPGNNVSCAGTTDKHNDGCPGAVVVIACKRVSAQTITFPNPGNQCSNTTVALTASASSALPVSYVVTSGPASLTGASARLTATGSVTITASQAGSSSFTAATPVSVTFSVYAKPVVSPGSVAGKLNQPLTYAITATGNPTSYGASGLPSGLSVNSGTGVISGTPAVTGTFPVTISASNAGGSGSATLAVTVSQTYSLAISGSPTNGGSFTGGGTYDPGTVVAISEMASSGYRASGWGGTDGSKTAAPTQAATTITMTGNRTLVANFAKQATLTVTYTAGGTAAGSGTFDVGSVVQITATPAGGHFFTGWSGSGVANSNAASTTLTLSGNEIVTASFGQPPVFTSGASTQVLVVGRGFTLPVTASGAVTYSAASLPHGLSIDSCSGSVSGTPTTPGSSSGVITASNTGGSASETVPFIVYPVPVITSPLSVTGKLNEPFSTTITATGNPTSFGATGLPPGLSLNPATGVISGTPTSTGSFPVTATATNPGTSGSATVTVHVGQTYTLAISGSPAAGGSYSGAGTYDPGTVVTVAETANTGYRASGWGGTDGGQTAAPTNATTTIVMSGNRSLAAKFVAQATLTVTAGIGGTATGGGVYDVGAAVPISATAATGYTFTAWTGTGVTQTGASSTTVTVAGDEIVAASFTQPPPPPVIPNYTLTITGSPAAGTFSGAGTYPAGTAVTITEVPANGYRTNGWSGPDAGSTAAPANATTTIVMSADRNLAANFVQQGTLTVTAGTGGTALGSGTYDVGTTVPINATPNSTYVFSGWNGAAADPAANSSTVTITGNLAVVANFTHVPQAPTATLNAATTAFTGSPFTVTSLAGAPDSNLTLHSIEWLSPSGAWTVDSTSASGSSDNRTLGITFDTTGSWTLRAGASVDNGVTWVYSPSVQVTVANGITSYTLQSMAVPNGNALAWYAPSPVAQKIYQVKHLNP
jgi:hypothetical protein